MNRKATTATMPQRPVKRHNRRHSAVDLSVDFSLSGVILPAGNGQNKVPHRQDAYISDIF